MSRRYNQTTHSNTATLPPISSNQPTGDWGRSSSREVSVAVASAASSNRGGKAIGVMRWSSFVGQTRPGVPETTVAKLLKFGGN